jgi:hypothetical protein
LLSRAVEPGGRLIIGGYSWFVDVRAWLRSCGFEAGGRFFGWPGCGGALGWVDRPS